MLLDDLDISKNQGSIPIEKKRNRYWLLYNLAITIVGLGGFIVIRILAFDFPLGLYFAASIFLIIGFNLGYWLVSFIELMLAKALAPYYYFPTILYTSISLLTIIYGLYQILLEYFTF